MQAGDFFLETISTREDCYKSRPLGQPFLGLNSAFFHGVRIFFRIHARDIPLAVNFDLKALGSAQSAREGQVLLRFGEVRLDAERLFVMRNG